MPPRRARGRHRRPRATGGPAYLSAVALVALAILGLNAPGTSDARQVSATAAGALAPHASQAPAPLLLQLCDVLRAQVSILTVPAPAA